MHVKRVQLNIRDVWDWDMDSGNGMMEGSLWEWTQKAKAQFSLALMPIFVPFLLTCYMWTCNDISRRWDGGTANGTLSWVHQIGGRGRRSHKSATMPRYPTLLAGSLTLSLSNAPPLISKEICNQRSPKLLIACFIMCFMFRTWLLAASHLSVEEGWCAAMSPCSLSLSCSQRARQSTNVATMNSQNYPQSHVDNPHVLQRECCTCGTSQCGSWVCVCVCVISCICVCLLMTIWLNGSLRFCAKVFLSLTLTPHQSAFQLHRVTWREKYIWAMCLLGKVPTIWWHHLSNKQLSLHLSPPVILWAHSASPQCKNL